MIELITNGALPRPGKCICCGYSGNDRDYFRFQAFIPRLGQILLCTSKPGAFDSLSGCVNEAARMNPLNFVERTEIEELNTETMRLRKENERLGVATTRFTDGFAGLVSSFLSELAAPVEEDESASDSTDETGEPDYRRILDSISGQAVGSDSFS